VINMALETDNSKARFLKFHRCFLAVQLSWWRGLRGSGGTFQGDWGSWGSQKGNSVHLIKFGRLDSISG
jgi:hypothetical protein